MSEDTPTDLQRKAMTALFDVWSKAGMSAPWTNPGASPDPETVEEALTRSVLVDGDVWFPEVVDIIAKAVLDGLRDHTPSTFCETPQDLIGDYRKANRL